MSDREKEREWGLSLSVRYRERAERTSIDGSRK